MQNDQVTLTEDLHKEARNKFVRYSWTNVVLESKTTKEKAGMIRVNTAKNIQLTTY